MRRLLCFGCLPLRRDFASSLLLVGACAAEPPPRSIAEADAPALVAEAVCRAEHECGCRQPAWPDRDTCMEAEVQALEDAAAIAATHDLVYDGECVARRVDAYDDAACAPEVPLDPCALACKAYVGTVDVGAACERLGITVDVDTCAQGLRCEAGSCVPRCDPAPPLAEGAVCAKGIEPVGVCEPALYCAPDTQRCAPRPAAGDPCPDDACLTSSYCDRADPAAPVCRARVPEGDACLVDTQCESDHCDEGGCAPLAAAACSFRGR